MLELQRYNGPHKRCALGRDGSCETGTNLFSYVFMPTWTWPLTLNMEDVQLEALTASSSAQTVPTVCLLFHMDRTWFTFAHANKWITHAKHEQLTFCRKEHIRSSFTYYMNIYILRSCHWSCERFLIINRGLNCIKLHLLMWNRACNLHLVP